jgi:hypothetical protein
MLRRQTRDRFVRWGEKHPGALGVGWWIAWSCIAVLLGLVLSPLFTVLAIAVAVAAMFLFARAMGRRRRTMPPSEPGG